MKRILIILGFLISFAGCSIDEDAPGTEYFLFKQWRLEKVTINGALSAEDIAPYRIELMEDFTFEETGVDENEYTGTWTLDNNGTILELSGTYWSIGLGCEQVEFLIVDLQLRELIVRPLKGCDKLGAGNLDIIFYLVPVKQ